MGESVYPHSGYTHLFQNIRHAEREQHPCSFTHVVSNLPAMAESLTPDIAANVRAEVARRRVRQADIADHLGLDQRAVSRRLLGQVEFSAAELRQLAVLLEVPASTLLGEVPA